MSPAERRERHKAWLASFGFSDEDWRRMRLLALDVTERASPPALRDLSVPVCVAALPVQPTYRSGKLLGTITQPGGLKVALICWPMADHERETHWAKARAARATGEP